MTALQRIRLRLSEVRERLNAIAGTDDLTDESRSEAKALQTEYADLETRHRAAIIAEGEPRQPENDGTGEGAEVVGLIRRARLGTYLAAVAEGRDVETGSPEAELRAAYDIADANAVPLAALAPTETRADANTSAPSTLPRDQDSILARVFARSATAFLASMERVAVGETSYPVLSSGHSPATVTKGTTHDSTAGSFSVTNLSPLRATGRYSFAIEDLAVLRGMESALRQDLAAAISDHMDAEVLTGDGTTASGVTHPSGFLDASGGSLTIPGNPSAVATYGDYLKAVGDQLDGKYASTTGDVRLLVGGKTAGHMVSVLQSGSGMTAWRGVSQLVGSGNLRVSGNVTAPASNVQYAIAKRGSYKAAVCPVWDRVSFIRDEITGAASGTVAITAVALYNFAITRAADFAVVAFKLA